MVDTPSPPLPFNNTQPWDLLPPPGYTPAFKGTDYFIVQCVLGGFMLLLLLLRLFSRIFLVGVFRLDDGLLVLAAATVGVQVGVHGLSYYKAGVGYHFWDSVRMSRGRVHLGVLYAWISTLLQIFSGILIRLAMLIYIARIIASRKTKFLLWGTAVLSTAFGIAAFLVNFFQCTPTSYTWTKGLHVTLTEWDQVCLKKTVVYRMTVLGHLVLNTWICGLAGYSLWVIQRQLRWKERYALLGCFFVGFCMLINSSVRASRTTEHAMSSDPTWLSADLCLMSALESIMGIIATCIPSLNPLMAAVLPTLWGPVSEPTPPRNFELTPKDVEELCVQEQFRPDVAFKNHARVLPLYKDAEGAGGRGIMVKVEYEQTSKVTKEKRGRWGRWRMLEG